MPPSRCSDMEDAAELLSSKRQLKHRDTIMTMVKSLLKEEKTKERELSDQEDDSEYPDGQAMAGAEAFRHFKRKLDNLDKVLRDFSNATRQLGSSAGILSSAFQLRERLAHVSHLYTVNASDLFPRLIKAPPPPNDDPVIPMPVDNKRHNPKVRLQAQFNEPAVLSRVDLEDFPEQFAMFAEDIMNFLDCLNEFPEFIDEAMNSSINSFAHDLKYWSSCLLEYKSQFRYPAVQRYLQDLISEMGEHIGIIAATLEMFIEVGVPTIQYAQKHGADSLLNLATTATFFSAVTASTLQFSYALKETPVQVAANVFWFSSLVVSIAAAVNSLMGLTWKQAMYRSPGNRVPWWVLMWIKRSPLVLLVMSVLFFSIGLCLFAYASNQGPVTATLTTVLTCVTSFGLGAVSLWFLSERLVYLRHSGSKWAGDILSESQHRLLSFRGIKHTRRFLSWFLSSTAPLRREVNRLSKKVGQVVQRRSSVHTSENTAAHENQTKSGAGMPPTLPQYTRSRGSTDFVGPAILASVLSSSFRNESPPSLQPIGTTRGKILWQNAIRAVRLQAAVSANLAALQTKSRRRSSASNAADATSIADRRKTLFEAPVRAFERIKNLRPKIEDLEITQVIPAHQGLVRHLQFSPDGRYLATSSWDRTSVLFHVADPFISHRILGHTKGRVSQIIWAPSGKRLATKVFRSIKIWTENGVCEMTMERPIDIEALVWHPAGNALFSVEENKAVKLDTKGSVLDTYDFGRVKLQAVAITLDESRLLGVGPLTESPSGLTPSRSQAEKRLVVYNMDTKEVEHQTPVLNDVRDVAIAASSKRGTVVLVSYDDNANSQLWRLEMVHNPDVNQKTARLILQRTYRPKVAVELAGPSYFAGRNSELVISAGKSGDIHIWDQESGELLRHISPIEQGGDLTSIAWNHASQHNFMFATGGHDGVVRIWTKAPEITDTPMTTQPPSPLERIPSRTDN